jgi:hypothetical protein
MLTLLIVTGTSVVLTAAYVLITRNHTEEVLACETTLAHAADPAAETLPDRPAAPTGPCEEWQLTTVSCLCDAEDLLDVLENQGVAERELVVLGNSTFAVRWR